MAILGCFRQFWDKKRANPFGFALCGRGIRIRTLNNGVRVRCVTVTLYLYIIHFSDPAQTSAITLLRFGAFSIITYYADLSR